ncbi:MAG: ADP-ribosylglycohydrolase family protein [Gaiellales bacterium]
MTAPDPPASSEDVPLTKAQASALWAAWGDALGFISELTDAAGLRRRTGDRPLTEPVGWKRRVGGRYGVIVELPAGCYSDDTQLRLATGRAIGPHGFDVEAFAKIELPVWMAYALGGGRGTKAAAANLARTTTQWFANTYEGWSQSGGNGAAMRIQPHVWHTKDSDDPGAYLPDVLRNAVCTHSHPNGLAGAALHAVALASVLTTGETITAAVLGDLIGSCRAVPDLIRADPELSDYWLPLWERDAGRPFEDAWTGVLDDAQDAVQAAAGVGAQGADRWQATLQTLHLFDEDLRGSGMLCAIAAIALGWCEEQPAQALVTAANAVGSDTDTIATMAGALFGAVGGEAPPSEVLDAGLISAEAARLEDPGHGAGPAGHRYPDLLRWKAPRSQADAVVRAGNRLILLGLGDVEPLADPITGPQSDFQWQWLRSQAGQTMIVKRRQTLQEIPPPPRSPSSDGQSTETHKEDGTLPFLEVETKRRSSSRTTPGPPAGVAAENHEPPAASQGEGAIEVDRVLSFLERKGFQDAAVGFAVRRVAERGSVEQLIALAVTIRERIRAVPTQSADVQESKPE